MKRIFMLIAVVLATATSHAEKDRGGGNAVGNELFDFYDAQSLSKIDVRNTLAYKQVLQPILTDLKTKLPILAGDIEFIIANKRWVLTDKPLVEVKCLNETMSGARKTVVACQNKIEIRILKQWFENPDVLLRDKAGLLLHEALRSFRLSDYSLHAITVGLFNSHRLTSSELKQMLIDSTYETSKLPLRHYYTQQDFCGVEATFIKASVVILCEGRSVKKLDRLKFAELMMNSVTNKNGVDKLDQELVSRLSQTVERNKGLRNKDLCTAVLSQISSEHKACE